MYDDIDVIGQYSAIPCQAFLYQPIIKNHEQTDDLKYIGSTFRRHMFEGGIQYTPFENNKLAQFQQYLVTKKIVLDERWNKSWKMRFLTSTGFNNNQTVKDMANYIIYQNKIKFMKIPPRILTLLNQGINYVCGRDCKYRPIMVFNVKKMIDTKMTCQELIEIQTHFFEFVMKQMLIPGQVQNWVSIIDVGYSNLVWLINPVKTSIQFLSSTFRNRMYAAYLVRCPSSVQFLWGIAKKFMAEDTIQKINFQASNQPSKLLQFTNPTQVQEKYGGKLKDMEEFWPPKSPKSSLFKVQNIPTKLLSPQNYQIFYRSGKLKSRKIYKPYIQITIEEKQLEYKQENKYNQSKINANSVKLLSLEAQVKVIKISCEEQYHSEIPSIFECINSQLPHIKL